MYVMVFFFCIVLLLYLVIEEQSYIRVNIVLVVQGCDEECKREKFLKKWKYGLKEDKYDYKGKLKYMYSKEEKWKYGLKEDYKKKLKYKYREEVEEEKEYSSDESDELFEGLGIFLQLSQWCF